MTTSQNDQHAIRSERARARRLNGEFQICLQNLEQAVSIVALFFSEIVFFSFCVMFWNLVSAVNLMAN